MAVEQKLVGSTVWTGPMPVPSAKRDGKTISMVGIVSRGFIAAHSALFGALCLFMLYAPGQVLAVIGQHFQRRLMTAPAGPELSSTQLALSLSLAFGTVALALAVFAVFPLVQGTILGQVRDTLASSEQSLPEPASALACYPRLLGNQALFMLALLAIMLPMMVFIAVMAFQVVENLASSVDSPQNLDIQQLNMLLLSRPAMIAGMVMLSILVSAVAMVYWLACAIVVVEREPVLASWGKALRFCRQNCGAVLAVWLSFVAVGFLTAPIGLTTQFGMVTDPWALTSIALVNSALVGYVAVLMAGLTVSLYLGRRPPSGSCEPELCCQPAVLDSGKCS